MEQMHGCAGLHDTSRSPAPSQQEQLENLANLQHLAQQGGVPDVPAFGPHAIHLCGSLQSTSCHALRRVSWDAASQALGQLFHRFRSVGHGTCDGEAAGDADRLRRGCAAGDQSAQLMALMAAAQGGMHSHSQTPPPMVPTPPVPSHTPPVPTGTPGPPPPPLSAQVSGVNHVVTFLHRLHGWGPWQWCP